MAKVSARYPNSAKIKRTILNSRQKTATQIKELLASNGIQTTDGAIKQMRYRLNKSGNPAGKICKTPKTKELLKNKPWLTNKAVVQELKRFGVSMQNVRDARHQLGQNASRQPRTKSYPKLSPKQERLVEESLLILKRLIWLKTVRVGRSIDYAEEAFLELSSKLPHWIAKKRPDAKLEAFLDFKTKYALRDFTIKTISQGSGLKHKEVRQGLKWRRILASGKTLNQVAREERTSSKEVREITMPLEQYFKTR